MNSIKIRYLSIFLLLYMVLSLAFAYFNQYSLSVWLGFNVALALIPVILVTLLQRVLAKNKNRITLDAILLFATVIFFFPNTFYIITDLIHLNSSDFYLQVWYSDTIYHQDIKAYLLLIHLVFSTVIGLISGIYVLSHLRKLLIDRDYHYIIIEIFILSIIVFSSIGIYLGRFLRFYTWDILNPIKVIGDFFEQFSWFTIEFILLFIVVQGMIYYGFFYLNKHNHSS